MTQGLKKTYFAASQVGRRRAFNIIHKHFSFTHDEKKDLFEEFKNFGVVFVVDRHVTLRSCKKRI